MGGGGVTQFGSHPSQPQVILASAYPDVYRSADGGITWSVTRGLPPQNLAGSFSFAQSDPAVVYANITKSIQQSPTSVAFVPAGIYKSTNGGADWASVNQNLPDGTGVYQIAVDPRTEQTVFIATSSGVYKTVNGGASWNQLSWMNLPAQSGVDRIVIDASRPDTIYATAARQLGRSIDGGSTWEELRRPAWDGWDVSSLLPDPFRRHTLLAGSYGRGAFEMTVAPDLSIEAAPMPRSVSSYTYTVSNLGPFHATDVRTRIQLPTSAGNVSATATSGTCAVQGVLVTCVQTALLAGRATEITVTPSAAEMGASIVASVESSESDIQLSNNSVSRTIQVSDLSVAVNAPATVTVGNEITYSIAIRNSGPSDASGVTATIQSPAGMSMSHAVASQGSCTVTSSLVTCTVDQVASGSSVSATVTATVATAGTYRLSATVLATGFDPTPADNSVGIDTSVNAATPPASNVGTGGSGTGGTSSNATASASSGGGGGSVSWSMLAAVALLAAARCARSRH
jgi:uncharacterized repeat protein (TIGR01451 family)